MTMAIGIVMSLMWLVLLDNDIMRKRYWWVPLDIGMLVFAIAVVANELGVW